MAASLRLPELHVEGKNDKFAIGDLLKKHGLECNPTTGPVFIRDHGSDENNGRGIEELLRDFEYAVQQSTDSCVGFVLDADQNFKKRWLDVLSRLQRLGADPPKLMPQSGLIVEVGTFHARVGIWLMPNNNSPGALEDFLRSLIPDDDPLVEHAKSSTKAAKRKGARFRLVDERKAILHAWLAWQKKPGLPYGSAINAAYFKHNRQMAAAFVAWFCDLYNLSAESATTPG